MADKGLPADVAEAVFDALEANIRAVRSVLVAVQTLNPVLTANARAAIYRIQDEAAAVYALISDLLEP